MRRWAQLSLYARGSRASDIASLDAAVRGMSVVSLMVGNIDTRGGPSCNVGLALLFQRK